MTDMVVIGSGPAGIAAAITVARRGHTVVIYDQQSFPRDKVCGDGLIADALEALRELSIEPDQIPSITKFDHIDFYSPNATKVSFDAPLYTCRRMVLDDHLRSAAMSYPNISFVTAKVEAGPDDLNGEKTFLASGTPIQAKYFIVANGASANGFRSLSIPFSSPPSAVALRGYATIQPSAISAPTIWFERPLLPGYAWLFPMGGGQANLGVAAFYPDVETINLRNQMDVFIDMLVERGILAARPDATFDLRGAPLRCGLEAQQYEGQNYAICGEAIGSTYALTGEGIGKALGTGMFAGAYACDRLASEQPAGEYREQLTAKFGSYFRSYEIGQNWMRRPWYADGLAFLVRASPNLRRMASEILSEQRKMSEALSPLNLTATLLGVRR